jgi:hypothetical protein
MAAVVAGASVLVLSGVILLEAPPGGYVGLTLAAALACWFGAWRGLFLAMGVERPKGQPDFVVYTTLFGSLAVLASCLWLLIHGPDPLWGGGAAGALVAAAVFAVVVKRRYLPLRRALKPRVWPSDAAELERAIAACVAAFESAAEARGADPEPRAVEAVVAAGQLSDLGRFQAAAQILNAIDVERLRPAVRAAVQASRATMLLYLRDRNGAWRALKEAFQHAADPRTLTLLKLTDALATAVDGHGAEALARLDEVRQPDDPRFRRAHLLTRAHALAGSGDLPGARTTLIELCELSREHSLGDVLARAAALGGPASALAEELARDGSPPLR